MPTCTEWLVFVGTAIMFTVTPGPTMLYVLARSLHGGFRDGALSATGTAMGTAAHAVAAAVGLSALLDAAPVASTLVKYVGAAYLVYLGVKAIRARQVGDGHDDIAGVARAYNRSPLAQGILVEALNPKTVLFFMALLPRFVDPHRDGSAAPPVFLVFGCIVSAATLATTLVVATAASTLQARVSHHARWQRRQRAASGGLMIGLGVFVAVA